MFTRESKAYTWHAILTVASKPTDFSRSQTVTYTLIVVTAEMKQDSDVETTNRK